ncbi:zinc ribbon domain-containing protein [Breznakia pachnodae]|uniref:Putative zinc ribbon domain-containing protein n=1 Tax=Breznakia pachnodae TaxID=265178 RepID=A0ABU0DXU6_9FIRM|nr:zinc ribbon domain-containing protein [Breznakia pachnodae]MDQ0359370.1 hypothetical protein [Breznakia pachnodae]
MKTCISCGMPLREKKDYPLEDESKDYCVHCANADGTLQTYDERLDGMTSFIIKTQGLDHEVAQSVAKDMMSKLPAWKDVH